VGAAPDVEFELVVMEAAAVDVALGWDRTYNAIMWPLEVK